MNMDNNQLTFVLNDKDGDKFFDTFAQTYLNGERLEAKSLNCQPSTEKVMKVRDGSVERHLYLGDSKNSQKVKLHSVSIFKQPSGKLSDVLRLDQIIDCWEAMTWKSGYETKSGKLPYFCSTDLYP